MEIGRFKTGEFSFPQISTPGNAGDPWVTMAMAVKRCRGTRLDAARLAWQHPNTARDTFPPKSTPPMRRMQEAFHVMLEERREVKESPLADWEDFCSHRSRPESRLISWRAKFSRRTGSRRRRTSFTSIALASRISSRATRRLKRIDSPPLSDRFRRPFVHPRMTNPPSTFRVCPQMLRARGEARKTAIAAMSSASCQRPSGTVF